MKKSFLSIAFLLVTQFMLAQETASTRSTFQYNIVPSQADIKVDGIESEDEWNTHQTIDQFYNHNPSDKGLAKHKTEVKLAYTNQMLYVFAKMYDEGKRVVQSLQRDSDNAHFNSDSFTIVIDPINTKQNGVMFGVNAGGAEIDGSLSVESSQTLYSETWDERWFSSVKNYDTYWIAEFAIPFSSLRYNENNREWGINFIRGDKIENFYYTWTPFPINFNAIDVNYMGTLVWSQVPQVKSNSVFVKPFSTASTYKTRVGEDYVTDENFDVGVDIKVPITTSLYGDLAINPDFSNADVDQEVVNITRFDISLPERREFFLENNDIFTNFGTDNFRPFFSRRIGLKNGESIPILFGAKVTGNLGSDFRLGAMNVQTKKSGDIAAENNTVLAAQYKVLKRSIIKGMFINRSTTGDTTMDDHSQNFGTEFTYISEKGNFNNTVSYHGSTAKDFSNGYFVGLEGSYNSRRFGAGWVLHTINDHYRADVGFTPRIFNYNADTGEVIHQGYSFVNPWMKYRFFPEKEDSGIVEHGARTWNHFYYHDNSLFERQNNVAYDLFFRNTASLVFTATHVDIDLQFPTNFLGDEFDNLPVQGYNYWNGSVDFSSDIRNRFTYTAGGTMGSFYNGNISTLYASTNYRFGNWGNFSLSYDYNNIDLPDNYGDVDIHLVKFNGALSFTNKLFLSNTVQYNTLSDNFSVFSRLQWRYSPLSDIFLVYNQNNNTNGFDLSNRSIILKLTYRFGL
ncbi:carbohydrate binding family 9 domain-containing protein [Muricauda sp. CAU 1633]|uniref:DUF5916 domain-containing protein n=1 Tax=Allomuricauda sp. CAU 1633 TaxID=2816036 RepID=UPI001A8C5951|nr:DUF5916 domain-containing protein [Muricauda sp. CAU 1633]MBO0323202.1 carbohydrate binding family 9 domain-containing protein [Muricauda sp. CAU 1633]